MPLFMDRHDVPGVTAEQVAQAHLADLEVAAKFGVQFLAYWFDADTARRSAWRRHQPSGFADGGPPGNARPHPERDHHRLEDNVLSFLGRMTRAGERYASGSLPSGRSCSRTCEGSTSMLEAVGQSAFMVLLTEHDLIIRRALWPRTGAR